MFLFVVWRLLLIHLEEYERGAVPIPFPITLFQNYLYQLPNGFIIDSQVAILEI